MARNDDPSGMTSPGGFAFGISGWNWADPKVTSITFFLDNTVKVCDQYGRPIRGIVNTSNNKEVRFAMNAPNSEESVDERAKLGTHQEVIKALVSEGVKWEKLNYSGWPQIPYDELKKLTRIPPTPMEELIKIKDKNLRKDAMRMRKEVDEQMEKELEEVLGE